MVTTHNLGFPRFGRKRELKQALEAYWRGDMDRAALEGTAAELRAAHWALQAEAGLDFVAAGDFSLYDGVLDMSAMLGVVPARFGHEGGLVDLDTYFRMARGRAPTGEDVFACEMTKWFDTNYHYIVPELEPDQTFTLSSRRLFDEVAEAHAAGHRVKPVLIGPVTYLALGKMREPGADKLQLLERLLPVYRDILERLAEQGVEWVQIDEPILVTDLDERWREAAGIAHRRLEGCGVNRLVATYFGALGDNAELAARLSKEGLHVDLVRAPEQIGAVAGSMPRGQALSVGVVDGRNVWRSDLERLLGVLQDLESRIGGELWVAPSCSLLHVPMDLAAERKLDEEIRAWLAFAVQKLDEVVALGRALDHGVAAVGGYLAESSRAARSRRRSPRIHKPDVRRRAEAVTAAMARRESRYEVRAQAQHRRLGLPVLPTTTIGSFPQTPRIRAARRDYRAGEIDAVTYESRMREEIEYAVRQQEAVGLDVLVHGEAERNDMVEYFGERLEGFCFTQQGWVQSFGSRGVKPPIIFGDVSRPAPMTVDWTRYAQSLTERPVKGMLTGPVTILQWSFQRDDQPRSATCEQIALALRDEVADLERVGTPAIQIDEPAFREGLPLRRGEWPSYLDWATRCFRLAAAAADDGTQIHTHMCYSEFNDIIEAIAAMDADVITIETARSDMELLDAFAGFRYPNEIGPGVYDIHSPRIPTVEEMVRLLDKAASVIPVERLWVNPDCGLKTRTWEDVQPALRNMVRAAEGLRARYAVHRKHG